MLKKLLPLTLVLILVAGTAGAGTWAYFNNTKPSTGNSFLVGTLDLQLCDSDEGWDDGVSASWAMPNFAPGDMSTVMYEVGVQNTGNLAGNHVQIYFSHEIDEASNQVDSDTNPNSLAGDLSRYVEIRHMSYNGHYFVGSWTSPGHTVVDANNNGWIDLEDVTLPENAAALDNLSVPLPNGGSAKNFHIALGFRPEAGNDLQGDGLLTTLTFKLHQDAGQ